MEPNWIALGVWALLVGVFVGLVMHFLNRLEAVEAQVAARRVNGQRSKVVRKPLPFVAGVHVSGDERFTVEDYRAALDRAHGRSGESSDDDLVEPRDLEH